MAEARGLHAMVLHSHSVEDIHELIAVSPKDESFLPSSHLRLALFGATVHPGLFDELS